MKDEAKLGKALDMKLIKRLLGYVKPYKKEFAVSFLLLALVTGTDLMRPYLIKVAIDSHILSGDYEGLLRIAAIFLVVIMLGFVFNYAQASILNIAGQKMISDLREEIFSHVQKLPMTYFDNTPIGRIVTRTTNDMENINDMFTGVLVNFFKDVLIIIGIVFVMFRLDHRLALLCLSTFPLIFIIAFVFRGKSRAAYRNTRVKLAKINSKLSEYISGMALIQVFNREKHMQKSFGKTTKEHFDATQRELFIYAVFRPSMDLVYSLTLALLLWYGGASIIGGSLQFGVFYAFVTYIKQLFDPINDLAEKFNILQTAMASSERIFLLLDEEIEEDKGESFPEKSHKGVPLIEFKDVWFRYGEGKWVLKGIDFKVFEGESFAVAGPTGAGKSTVAGLIMRFYKPVSGKILFKGVDIEEIPLEKLRSSIGYVMQDVFLFSGTIVHNIGLGSERVSLERVKEAAVFVNASDFIKELPSGYDQILAERGASLSAGQRQLLSMARATAFEPELLILDEATANIDTQSEMIIQEAIAKLMGKTTAIVIAHRLSTIKNADRTIYLKDGKIDKDMFTAHMDE